MTERRPAPITRERPAGWAMTSPESTGFPFPDSGKARNCKDKEAELKEKETRLKELNILLNMDEKNRSLIDEAPEEEPESTKNRDYALAQ